MRKCSKILETEIEKVDFSTNKKVNNLMFFLSFKPSEIIGQLDFIVKAAKENEFLEEF